MCKCNKDAGALVAHTVFDILESRIAERESNKKPEFTWCQPLAKLPDHPDIESFLKGPQEKYVHRGAKSLLAAKSIVERFFHTSREYGSNRNSASDGYSAIGTVGEPGRVIVIQKTRRMFQVAMEIWHTEQEETKRLRLELGKGRLALPQNELVALTTCSDCSGGGGSKLQRLDTKSLT